MNSFLNFVNLVPLPAHSGTYLSLPQSPAYPGSLLCPAQGEPAAHQPLTGRSSCPASVFPALALPWCALSSAYFCRPASALEWVLRSGAQGWGQGAKGLRRTCCVLPLATLVPKQDFACTLSFLSLSQTQTLLLALAPCPSHRGSQPDP